MCLLTAQDVANRLRVTRQRVYEMIRAGELRSIKVGRLVRIDEADLQDWLDKGGSAQEVSRGT